MRNTKLHTFAVGVLQMLLVLNILVASQATRPEAGRPKFEVSSHRVVESVRATFGQVWTAKEPARYKGLVVALKMTFEPGIGKMSADDFSASFISQTGIDRALSFGITLPFPSLDDATDAMKDLWLFQEPTGNEKAVVHPENMKCCTAYFSVLLAPLPLDANEVSLMHKGSVLATRIHVKR